MTGLLDIEHLDGLGDTDIIAALTCCQLATLASAGQSWPGGAFASFPLRARSDPGQRRRAPWRSYAAALLWPAAEVSDPKERALKKLEDNR